MLLNLIRKLKPEKLPKLDSGTPAILIIAPRFPEFDRASGDLRLFRLIEILVSRYQVVFYNDGMWERFYSCGDTRYYDALRTLGVHVLVSVSSLWKVLEQHHFVAVIDEFYHLAEKYQRKIKRLSSELPIVVDSVDVHFLRERLMAETLSDSILQKRWPETKRNEISSYDRADYVWVVSELDKQVLVTEGICESKICIVPNVHVVANEPPPPLEQRKPNTLLFVGGFVHQPNVDAVVYFCRDIFPLVLNHVPDAQLMLVGDNPPEEIRSLASAHISVLGFVPDTKPYINNAVVSVVPLRYGAGLKGKVGEALSSGLPLVTTSIGSQGMSLVSGEDCFVTDAPHEFADCVISLLRDAELWRKFSTNGRTFMSEYFGYDSVRQRLLDFFALLEKQ